MATTKPKTLAELYEQKEREAVFGKAEETVTIGRKYDAGKPRYGLIKADALEEVVKVLTYGANKYSPDNWKHVDNMRERYFDAAQRHIWAWQRGEMTDPESGLNHLAHAMSNLMFLLQSDIENA